jgi:hypothetical protein
MLFEQHFRDRYIIQSINNTILEGAKAIVDRYGLRAYDAIQLAGCLELRSGVGETAPTFVCSDHDLVRAAALEGLEVLNPAD